MLVHHDRAMGRPEGLASLGHLAPVGDDAVRAGAADSEGYYHGKYALVDYVKRKMNWWDVNIEDYV